MLVSMNQFQREQTAEKTVAALKYKKSLGHRTGGIPFGHVLAKDGKTLVPCADEQKALKVIKDLRHRGKSLRQIADELTRKKVATKNGGQWQVSSIARILKRVG